jgi:NADPH:quinone reductase-like Zn-dependent oxidoreductase
VRCAHSLERAVRPRVARAEAGSDRAHTGYWWRVHLRAAVREGGGRARHRDDVVCEEGGAAEEVGRGSRHQLQRHTQLAAKLSPGGTGVQHVVEVGGPSTMAQSLKAVAIDGVISIIGFIGGFSKEQPTFLDCLNNICTVRGILVGSRLQFEDMCAAIEGNDIHPVVDEKVFELKDLKEAYQYMWDQKHFGKLTVKVAE